MRVFAICLTALLLLAAGCAANRGGHPDIAPSRQAALNDGNSGWSVPPGQKQVTDPQPGATSARPIDDPSSRPAALQGGQGSARRTAPASELTPAPAAGPTPRQEAPQAQRPVERVAPIVPAFPVRIQQERVLALRTVHFDFDSWALVEEAQAILTENAGWLKANPDVVVRVGGHADERGTSEYNLALGERRAKIVRDFLVKQGVPEDNLITVSYGEEVPIDPASTTQAWSLNRRAEFSRAEGKQVSSVSGPQSAR